jgi:plastocyanin
MRSRHATWAVVLVLGIAGCGSDDEGDGEGGGGGGGGGGGQTLSLAADPGGALEFTTTELKAEAGSVTIDFDNPASVPHAVEIEGNGVEAKSETVTGGKASVTAEVEAGTYTFYCPVGSHRENGMEGTLTVE